MSFYWAWIAFHWVFITVTLILCVVASMPTRGWMRLGAWVKGRLTQRTQSRLDAALAAAPQPFTAQTSFFARGGGLALDGGRGLVFLAMPEGKALRSLVVPAARVQGGTVHTLVENGFQQIVLELQVADEGVWRLPCADMTLANDMQAALAGFTLAAKRGDQRG